jgi:hypothetical protein
LKAEESSSFFAKKEPKKLFPVLASVRDKASQFEAMKRVQGDEGKGSTGLRRKGWQ